MRLFARFVLFSSILSLSAAFAEELPNPFFPPDPWEDLPPAAMMMSGEEELPNPFFPPDPWEDLPPA